jgi:opacity protein-like surface antigen
VRGGGKGAAAARSTKECLLTRRLLTFLAFALCHAVPARADIVIVAYLGQSWSGVINDADAGYPTTYGARLEWFGNSIVGVGVDVARTPDFLANAQGRVRESTLSTFMANLIVGGPLPQNRGFRPYLSGGIGALKYDLTRTTGQQASKTDFGYNVGVGASVLFSRHVGAELDVRYFRNTRDFTLGGLDFPENILEYARWSGGLVLRF